MEQKLFYRIGFGIFIGAALLALWAVFLSLNAVEAEVEPLVPEKALAQVELLTPRTLAKNRANLLAYGAVDAVQELPLVFEGQGTLTEVYVQPGAVLRKGQAIARLSNAALDAQIAQVEAAYNSTYYSYLNVAEGANEDQLAIAESQLRNAETQLEMLRETPEVNPLQIDLQRELVRQTDLNYKILQNGASGNALASQRSLVDQAAAGLQGARASYDKLVLRAPFDGELVSLDLQVGAPINPGNPVGYFFNKSQVEIVTYLSSQEADRLEGRGKVLVDGKYEGEVIGISSRVDPELKKRKIRISLSSLDGLTVGQTVSLSIEEAKPEVGVLAPVSAVLFDEDEAYVFTYKQGVLKKMRVEIGQIRGQWIEIFTEIKDPIIEQVRGRMDGEAVQIAS